MSVTASVVGVGKIGRKHASILATMPDVTLGPLVDVDTQRASNAATELRTSTGSIDEAISEADCLFVCTPDDEHTEIAIQSIDAGVHTFVEKPLATTTTETERLQAVARQSDATHMVGHALRFDPRYRSIRTAMSDGDLGELVTITMERFVKRDRVRRTGAVSPPWMRLGVHDFDLLEWLFDVTMESLVATTSEGALQAEGYDISETVSVLAKLDTDATASLNMGFCLPDGHHGSEVRTEAIGTDGTITVDASGSETQFWDDTMGKTIDTHLWPEIAGVPDGALARQNRGFIQTVQNDEPSPVPFTAGHRAVQISETVASAVNSNGQANIPPS